MGLFKSFFRSKRLNKVFTPSQNATLNYIDRSRPQLKLEEAIDMPGCQIILYGNSGCGKSSLLTRALKNPRKYVLTQCIRGMSFSDVINRAFQDLGTVVETSYSKAVTSKIGGSVGYRDASVSSEMVAATGVSTAPLVKPTSDIFTLSRTLGKQKRKWVIDDFHNLSKAEKEQLANSLKVFVDSSNMYPETKIICIGATDNPNELLSYNPSLSGSVKNLRVDDMSDKEIKGIITSGCSLLNVSFSDSCVNEIVRFSHHMPAVAHSLCFTMCRKAGVKRTKLFKTKVEDRYLKEAIQEYVDNNSAIFDKVSNLILEDEALRDVVLLFVRGDSSSLSLAKIERSLSRKGYSREQVDESVSKLSEPSLALLRYDEQKQKYFFADEFTSIYLDIFLELHPTDNNRDIVIKDVDKLNDIYYLIALYILGRVNLERSIRRIMNDSY